MISKIETLKRIKEKVDARANGKVKLKKRVETTLEVGIFKHTEKRVFKELFKKGNSIFCVDENYEVHNINELNSTALRTMLWQLITDKEKKEIALEHLYATMSYLKEL
jgi:phosphopantothenate synthetase